MSGEPDGRLPRLAMAKVAFALVGVATFGLGIRFDNTGVRWAGIVLVAVAWCLRFVKRPA